MIVTTRTILNFNSLVNMETTNDIRSYLTFRVDDELFAVNAGFIHSIIEIPTITKLVRMPEFMMGIIDLREQPVPVINTRKLFGMNPGTVTPTSCIIVIEQRFMDQEWLIGFMADSVTEVIDIDKGQILSTPDMGGKYDCDLIEGVIRYNKAFIMLLQIDELFTMQEISQLVNVENTIRTNINPLHNKR